MSPAEPSAGAARGSPRMAAAALALAVVVIVVDQLVKLWAVGALGWEQGSSIPLAGPLRLTMVHNTGVSYGLFRASADWMRWALVVFSIGVAGMLAVWARRADRWLMALGLGLVIGGALGNAIDRARLGWGIDFIDVSQLHFPWVFNVADSAITVGVILLLLDSVRKDRTA